MAEEAGSGALPQGDANAAADWNALNSAARRIHSLAPRTIAALAMSVSACSRAASTVLALRSRERCSCSTRSHSRRAAVASASRSALPRSSACVRGGPRRRLQWGNVTHAAAAVR